MSVQQVVICDKCLPVIVLPCHCRTA